MTASLKYLKCHFRGRLEAEPAVGMKGPMLMIARLVQ